ncbi:N-acyl-phosphatidylethanolamine-hydrolyzing phospholipase D-like [Convolutriloba macropyga]|uniref:N-acyl-phosphatidylethanolamine-hydrolyzing phospholipase D-like n=1 Tax=Convolutriloba macropyga TaxID=536237 RepID=UPI003F51EF6D
MNREFQPTCDGYGNNHRYSNGKFFNPWSREAKGLGFTGITWEFLKYMRMHKNPDTLAPGEENLSEQEFLDKRLPVLNFDGRTAENAKAPDKGMRCVWLGHASCLVQFDNISILADPLFSDHCAPFQFKTMPKRLRKVPCTVEELPPIDIVVISHNHYDHLDYHSVKALNESQGSRVSWFVGLGLKKWFKDMGIENVYELDWWEEHKLNENITVVFTPTQHWSKRTPFDTNWTLWGSWLVRSANYKFLFLGDTGYCQTFKTIGDKFGPIDLAAIPIGAYHPRKFLELQHVDPKQAVQIHKDVQAKKSIGIHWGTFTLGREAHMQPKDDLAREVRAANLTNEDFFTTNIGECVHLFT